jgi:hypothetical protein
MFYVHVIKVLWGPRVAASPGTSLKDRMDLKDRLEPPACRSSRPQPKRRKGGEGARIA